MRQKIAILVIHGIGEQEPFETLDAFAKPFIQLYQHKEVALRKRHELKKMSDWVESCVFSSANNPSTPEIDIYEYYWAHVPQREITFPEVVAWIKQVARGAESFYGNRKEQIKTVSKNNELFRADGEFQGFKYLVKLIGAGNKFWFILSFILKRWAFSKIVTDYFMRKVSQPMVDLMGDVAVYCSMDKKSRYSEVRRKILSGAVEKTRALVKNDEYNEVLLVGHSLGSVIAYDTLDRLNREMNVNPELKKCAPKVKGLVTFGSPLDKIAFFFDEQIDKVDQPYRHAITSQLHGFRRANVDTETIENGVQQNFEHVRWFNFWTKPDPVCGHLDVYRDVINIEMDFSKEIGKNPLASHSQYWKSEKMFQKIIEGFIEMPKATQVTGKEGALKDQ